MEELYAKYITKLVAVNDENTTIIEHDRLSLLFRGWIDGIADAGDVTFNGDYYYLEKFDSGEMKERPICCGVFLDWSCKKSEEK